MNKYPPRPWFISPVDLKQLWLVVPFCMFLCILKYGVIMALFYICYWISSRASKAKQKWIYACDNNLELNYTTKEALAAKGYFKTQNGNYVYFNNYEIDQIKNMINDADKKREDDIKKYEPFMREYLTDIILCNMLNKINYLSYNRMIDLYCECKKETASINNAADEYDYYTFTMANVARICYKYNYDFLRLNRFYNGKTFRENLIEDFKRTKKFEIFFSEHLDMLKKHTKEIFVEFYISIYNPSVLNKGREKISVTYIEDNGWKDDYTGKERIEYIRKLKEFINDIEYEMYSDLCKMFGVDEPFKLDKFVKPYDCFENGIIDLYYVNENNEKKYLRRDVYEKISSRWSRL